MSNEENQIESLVKDEIQAMPEPTPFADKSIEENKSDAISSGEKPSIETPSVVRPVSSIFDPSIHATDTDGNPIINANGEYAKKRGRKPGSINSPNLSRQTQPQTNPEMEAAKQAGKATAEIIFALGGDEWRPIVNKEHGIDEPKTMSEAWGSYYLATGKTDMPPWVVLVVAMVGYSLPRFRMPQTQSRLQRFWGWCKSKFSRKK